MSYFSGGGGGLVGTASLLLTRRLGDSWGVHAGLVGHVINGEYVNDMATNVARYDAHLFLFTGLRRRL